MHVLILEPMPNSLGIGTRKFCIHLDKSFVQKMILNKRLTYMWVFNATKLFNSWSYFEKEDQRNPEAKSWLICLCEKIDVEYSSIID